MFSWVKFRRSSSLPEIQADDIGKIIEVIMDAIVKDNEGALRELADRNLIDDGFRIGRSKRSIIHLAASFGAVNCLRHLAKRGFNVNVTDIGRVTPLHLAARNGHKACVKALVADFGADTTMTDCNGFTVLHWLASNGRTQLLNYALLLGLSCDVIDTHGQTLLHVACHSGHAATVEQLITHGVDVNAQDDNFMTALHSVCKFGQPACASTLLKHGARQLLDKDGKLAIAHALENGQKECALLLLEYVPELMSHVLRFTLSSSADFDTSLETLKHLCTSRNSFAQAVIAELVSSTLLTGQKLLCTCGELDNVVPSFRRFASLLSLLLEAISRDPDLRLDDMLQQLLHREVDTLQQLWDTLHHWLSLMEADASPLTDAAARQRSSGAVRNSNDSEEEGADQQAEGRQAEEWSRRQREAGERRGDVAEVERREESDRATQPSHDVAYAREMSERGQGQHQLGCPHHHATEERSRAGSNANAEADTKEEKQWQEESARSGLEAYTQVDPAGYEGESEGTEARGEHEQESSGEEPEAGETEAAADRVTHTQQEEEEEEQQQQQQQQNRDQDADGASSSSSSSSSSSTLELARRIMLAVRGMYQIFQARYKPGLERVCSSHFLDFAQSHASAFHRLVSTHPSSLLEDFDFVLNHQQLIKVFRPAVLQQSFADRRQWFNDRLSALHTLTAAPEPEARVLVVDRNNLLQSSCERLQALNPTDLRNPFTIEFRDEAGHGHGVKREWFALLSKEIFNPDYALFELSPDEQSYVPNINSSVNPDHLSYFRFVGRILALSLLHRQTLPVRLSLPVYKHLLGMPPTIEDVALLDPTYAQSLEWILQNDIQNAGLDLTFSVEHEAFGHVLEEDLIPNGHCVSVTDANKKGYVEMLCEWKMTKAVSAQLNAIAMGFSEYIPPVLVQLFRQEELAHLISGQTQINVDDWRSHTDYSGFEEGHDVVQWFWECVAELSQEKRSLLLQFATGSPTLPAGGFQHIPTPDGMAKFTVTKMDTEHELPTASTCFNLLRLPTYASKASLRNALDTALTLGSQGFAFA